MKNSYKKEGEQFYAIPTYTVADVQLEIQSFNSSRFMRLRKRKPNEISSNLITPNGKKSKKELQIQKSCWILKILKY